MIEPDSRHKSGGFVLDGVSTVNLAKGSSALVPEPPSIREKSLQKNITRRAVSTSYGTAWTYVNVAIAFIANHILCPAWQSKLTALYRKPHPPPALIVPHRPRSNMRAHAHAHMLSP